MIFHFYCLNGRTLGSKATSLSLSLSFSAPALPLPMLFFRFCLSIYNLWLFKMMLIVFYYFILCAATQIYSFYCVWMRVEEYIGVGEKCLNDLWLINKNDVEKFVFMRFRHSGECGSLLSIACSSTWERFCVRVSLCSHATSIFCAKDWRAQTI